MWNFKFFFNSALFGVGLAMDAFSVSLANGLNEPKMKKNRIRVSTVKNMFMAIVFVFFCIENMTEKLFTEIFE